MDNKEKTLLLITGSWGIGGLERISANIVNRYSDKGWKVVYLALFEEEANPFFPIRDKIVLVHGKYKRNPLIHKYSSLTAWIKLIRNTCKKYDPNNIICMTFKIGSLLRLASKKYLKRTTIREIADPASNKNKLVILINQILCRPAKNFIFQTNWEKQCYNKHIAKKGTVIYNPCVLMCKKDSLYFREQNIVSTGRLTFGQKRYDILLKSFDIFHNTHPNIFLDIYGTGSDEEKIRSLANSLASRDNIRFHPKAKNIQEIIKNAGCFLTTSDFEGMSNSLLEAYLLGIPCVSSDWHGVEEIIQKSSFDGLIYSRQDCNMCASMLAKIFDDPKGTDKMVLEATKRRMEFDFDTLMAQYESVIEADL